MACSLDRPPRFARHAVSVLESGDELMRTLDALAALGYPAGAVSLTAANDELDRLWSDETADGSFAHLKRAASPGGGGAVEVGKTGFVVVGPLSVHLSRLAGARALPIEGLLATWLPARNAEFLSEQLKAGRMLLWVEVDDAEEERQACGVLLGNSRHRVQVHDLPLKD